MGKPHERVSRGPTFPLTVSALARKFGLSRSALLYYDRLGLVRPSTRSGAGYRLYSEQDAKRLERVVALSATGMALEDIGAALDRKGQMARLLGHQLNQLSAQAEAVRAQQQVLAQMLCSPKLAAGQARLGKDGWTEMFRAIGLSDDDMRRWHAEFERSRPEAHRAFLASLGIAPADIARIRRWAKSKTP